MMEVRRRRDLEDEMKSRRSKFNGSKQHGAALLLTVCLSVFTLILVGCPERENDAVSGIASPQTTDGDLTERVGAGAPTIDELADRLSLNEAQVLLMGAALDELRLAIEARREMRDDRDQFERGPGGGHHGSGRSCDGEQRADAGERPQNLKHQFVMSCCEFLSLEQRGELISLMAERREAAMAAWTEKSEGRRPRRGGHHGGSCADPAGGNRHGGHGDFDCNHGQMLESLELTEAQQMAIDTLHQEMRDQMQALRQQVGSGGMSDDLREQITALRESMKTRMQEILTEEQQAQLQALRDGRRSERRCEQLTRRLENVGRGAERRLAHLTTILDLTADQISQVEAIQAGTVEQQRVVIQGWIDGTLTREEARAQKERLHEQTIAQIRAVLTEEQAELFDLLTEFFASSRGHGRRGCR
jgi:Spy/CpxP family protein refolding chaperone